MARPANTSKINGMPLRAPRPKKEPMPVHEVVPAKCHKCSAGTYEWKGVAMRVIPAKWQYTCSDEDCGHAIMSYTAPAEWAAMEAARLREAKLSEVRALAAQKLKVEMMGAIT